MSEAPLRHDYTVCLKNNNFKKYLKIKKNDFCTIKIKLDRKMYEKYIFLIFIFFGHSTRRTFCIVRLLQVGFVVVR